MFLKNKKYKNALIFSLIKKVFVIYLVIATFTTLAQIIGEYSHLRESIRNDMDALEKTFSPFLVKSLWIYDHKGIMNLMNGMLNNPSISGVTITDLESGKEYSVGKKGGNEEEILKEIIRAEYPIKSGKQKTLGVLGLESDTGIIISEISHSIIFILINAIIKSMALLTIFLIVFRRKVLQPLQNIQKDLDSFGLHHSHPEKAGNEIEKINDSIKNLRSTLKDNASYISDLSETIGQSMNHSKQDVQKLFDKLNKNLQIWLKPYASPGIKEPGAVTGILYWKSKALNKKIPVSQVAFINISEHYVELKFLDGESWKTEHRFGNLKEYEEKYKNTFVRVNRRSLVNPKFIKSYLNDGSFKIILDDDLETEFMMSSSGKKKLNLFLNDPKFNS